jgi:hypothetical protein
MILRVATSSAKHGAIPSALLIVLAMLAAGCGSGVGGSATADPDPLSSGSPSTCSATVLDVLGHVALRVYNEGVASERTEVALRLVARSIPLREAVEHNNSRAARAAAAALLATGHLTNLTVLRGKQTMVDVGAANALAPLHGSILSAKGIPIASFITSVWADGGFIDEMQGVAEGDVALRKGNHTLPGSFALPAAELPPAGTFSKHGAIYQYTSFPATVYPSGGSLRVYLLRSVRSTAGLCGSTAQDTLVNTLSHIAHLIYAGEGGARALVQVHRVQRNQALLSAVANRAPNATRGALDSLLHQHIVRLRVSAGGHLLADVGGPYVLAPVRATLRLHGRQIGNLVLSIQDDEGYLRLARRLAGLHVLMYMGGTRLVKNSLGPAPGAVPTSGLYRYRGHTFRVFTLNAHAFPSGPLRISVLIPIPYS